MRKASGASLLPQRIGIGCLYMLHKLLNKISVKKPLQNADEFCYNKYRLIGSNLLSKFLKST